MTAITNESEVSQMLRTPIENGRLFLDHSLTNLNSPPTRVGIYPLLSCLITTQTDSRI